MPEGHTPYGFQSLNDAAEKFRRCFFVIFQYLRWNLLPSSRQKLPVAPMQRRGSATVGAIVRHRGAFRKRQSQRGRRNGYAHSRQFWYVRSARIDNALQPVVAHHHFAPGNFCRIIDLDIIVFLESVSRAACVFESRANIF
jgi:hypothetical protein